MQIQGTVSKVYCSKPDWASIQLIADTGTHIQANGKIIDPMIGFSLILTGEYIIHPTYGKQFIASNTIICSENKEEGTKQFLIDCIHGIGPKHATSLVQKFGDNTISVLLHHTDRTKEIKGFGKKSCENLTKEVEKKAVLLSIYQFTGGQITCKQAKQIYGKYKEHTEEVLASNPYRLMYDIKGFGYKKVDKIAKTMGYALDAPERISATIYYLLDEAANKKGHTYLPLAELINQTIYFLGDSDKPKEIVDFGNIVYQGMKIGFKTYLEQQEYPEHVIEWGDLQDRYLQGLKQAIQIGIDNQYLVLEDNNLYKYHLYQSECVISHIIKERIQKFVPMFSDLQDLYTQLQSSYNQEQIQGIITALSSPVSILTGGPGRGKTHVTSGIISKFLSHPNHGQVILLAPTGKAAMRMTELTGYPASTIHRFYLSKQPVSNHDLVIIDESSMLDVSLAAIVLQTCKAAKFIVFVGDKDQLASIGPGNVLNDLISSNIVPTTTLIECFRNSGSIVYNADLTNQGQNFYQFQYDDSFSYISTKTEDMQEQILLEYQHALQMYDVKDICVLTPMQQRSTSGAIKLNNLIREMVNPGFGTWRVNDRVIQTVNNYSIETRINGQSEFGIFNGDLGTIINIENYQGTTYYEVLFDNGRTAYLDAEHMQKMQLAYALTIHKSQGSEYKYVIIPMNTDHFIMLVRNLLYTAITRASEHVTLIGSDKSFNIAIHSVPDQKRNTSLSSRLS